MLEPWQWALGGLAAFLVGVSKTGVPGLGILSVALFASALPARESVGIALVVLLAGDLVAVTSYRSEASWPHLGRLFPWAGGGVLLGALAFGQIPAPLVRVVIGAILVVMVVLHLIRRYRSGSAGPEELPPWAARGTGMLAGFTTMIANAGGPPMTIYMLSLRLEKRAFVATAAWFFFVLNVFKLPWSYGLGLITPDSLRISLILAPWAVGGALAGRRLLAYINQHLFEQVALALALAAGLRLLVG